MPAEHRPGGDRGVLDRIPFLQLLPADARKLVEDSFVPVSFEFGSEIVREGDEADDFYVLTGGRARVLKAGESGEEVPLAVLRPGDTFGEIGLLETTRRTATVRATSDVEALRLNGAVFRALVESSPAIRASFDLLVAHRHLTTFFRVYSPFAHLPAESLRRLLREIETEEVAAGTLVCEEGDEPDAMYVVEEGRLRVFRQEEGRRVYLAYLRKGDFFGEAALFRGRPRDASVEAVSGCTLLRLGRSTFEKLAAESPEFRTRIEEQIAQYDYRRVARVPLDFAEELLPAETRVAEKVGDDQVDAEAAPAGPFASEEGHFVKRPGRIRRFPHVSQIDEMDCAAACVAMVCRHFGRSVSLARIRRFLYVGPDGTSLRAICHGANLLGLAARSVKVSRRNLQQMPLPAVLHWQGNHWVVLYDVDETHARIADPASHRMRISRAELDASWSGYAALFDYTGELEKMPEGDRGLGWLWPFIRPHMPLLWRSLGLAAVVSALEMTFPVFTQVVVDRVLVEQDVGLLRQLILGLAAALGLMLAALYVQRYLLSFSAVRIDASSLDYLTRRLLRLPMSYFHTRRTGDIQRRFDGAEEIREFLSENAVSGLTAVTQLTAALVLMFVYSPILACVFLVVTPLYVLLMRYSAVRLRPLFSTLEEAFGRYESHQIDAIKGIETVKATSSEEGFRERMLSEFHRVANRVFRSDITAMGYENAIKAVSFLTLILFLWVGAHQVLSGNLTIGGFVAFNVLLVLANDPVDTLLSLWDEYQYSTVLVARLNDLLDHEPEQGSDHSALKPVRTLEGEVELHDVGFRYGGPESPTILEGISLEVPAGKTVAIVGRSGSGKTTLVRCLAGLIEPTAGTIRYDGVDLRTLDHRDLRRHIGFVPQTNHLFDDSIAANIALGVEEPDMNRVLWAARLANVDAFVDRMPLGYETRIGEGGVTLSGGQRQRVAIARAVYKQPPVIILDEATSSLDTESERAIQENLDRLLEGRTCFIIAHRLSTVRSADLIIVLEQGRIVERGTHEQLMARQGLYFYLCSQQLGV